MREQVAIIGAGVSGLTCGVVFAEQGYRTTIIARETGRATTSSVAAAIWFPYDAEPAAQVVAWSLATFDVLRELARDRTTGVAMTELRCFARAGELPIPEWAHSLGAEPLPATQIPARIFTSGFAVEVPVIDTTIYLDYLTRRFAAAGGELQRGLSLPQLGDVPAGHELIVNCSGAGARELVHDAEVEPHRGQVAIVPKLPLPCAVVCDDPPLMYAIPRTNDCVLGGTNEISDDCAVDPQQTAQILAESCRVLQIDPPLLLDERVGLRPYRRSGIRLEREQLPDGRTVLHNYGHGGSGFTLAWGCAGAVLRLHEDQTPNGR
ncbi:FAD-dependent oxidoreductase [soil metagenome]